MNYDTYNKFSDDNKFCNELKWMITKVVMNLATITKLSGN